VTGKFEFEAHAHSAAGKASPVFYSGLVATALSQHNGNVAVTTRPAKCSVMALLCQMMKGEGES
jgi:hypothetical protein